ncbi:Gfo/Idh/MocA family oxidoreductase [Salipaludibacillus sp. LMS25]|uniref:Gfo/Idh/MocA family protein n=1 Tax=Salipaludibacillus sp. LMS25 TaxID=2924031 RepID=UPI0020D05489|nr:Gfo/Idh/MocA family oxidoreductase [Salipaludibacillus sp. LMS25]UTR14721.1 Gfo/Idh/MocA family oxidoreductase [Salipaludibacillus sp. LMS25]
MADKVSWGVLSSANIAKKSMVPAIHEAENAELVGVASESGKAKETAEQWGARKYFDSYEALLQDDSIDVVYLPLPNALHKDWFIKAAQHKKHVLVEKPAALKSEDIIKMNEAAEENHVIWMEAFMYQFHPQHQCVKSWLSDGRIGDIKRIRASFSFPLDLSSTNIRLNNELGGGSLYDVGCYCVHVSRFLLEEEPIKVFATARKLAHSNVDIATSAILTFEKVDAVIDCSFNEAKVNRYEVIGTNGSIEVPYAFRPDHNPDDGKGTVILKNVNGNIVDYQSFEANQFTEQVKHFSQCILSHKTPHYSPESTFNNMKVLEALYKSLG